MSSYRKTPATGNYWHPSSITKTGKRSYKYTICRRNLIIYKHRMDTVTVGTNFGNGSVNKVTWKQSDMKYKTGIYDLITIFLSTSVPL